MEKIKIRKTFFRKSSVTNIRWSDLNHIKFQDDDIIDVEYVEPDELSDGYYTVEVIRLIEENDEEFKERSERIKQSKEMLKEKRYERYLELKKEFEPDEKRKKEIRNN